MLIRPQTHEEGGIGTSWLQMTMVNNCPKPGTHTRRAVSTMETGWSKQPILMGMLVVVKEEWVTFGYTPYCFTS